MFMSTIFLSIHPDYVHQILAGTKRFEFRRQVAKCHVDQTLIYTFFSGISRDRFMEYFSQKEIAYAYQLGEVKKFKKAKDLSEYGISAAPQSFVYIES